MDQEEFEQDLSDEQINALFDHLERLSAPKLSRNDPCNCVSGLKYKKCCLAKNKNMGPSVLRVESFEIKTSPLTPEESKNNFAEVSPEDDVLLKTLYYNLQKQPETIDSENSDYFKKLNALQVKYPNNPLILNYLTNGYAQLGQQEKVENLIAETYNKFPDYLFAKTAQANIYLKDGFPEKALRVLKGAYTLTQLYQDRTVFHVSEVRAFEFFMVRYFCEIGSFEQADLHFQFMQKFLEEDDALLRNAQKSIKKSKVHYNLKAGMSKLVGLSKK